MTLGVRVSLVPAGGRLELGDQTEASDQDDEDEVEHEKPCPSTD